MPFACGIKEDVRPVDSSQVFGGREEELDDVTMFHRKFEFRVNIQGYNYRQTVGDYSRPASTQHDPVSLFHHRSRGLRP